MGFNKKKKLLNKQIKTPPPARKWGGPGVYKITYL